MHKAWTLFLLLGFITVAAIPAMAAYPEKPIQLIVPYSAGGSTDVLARAISQVASKHFPQPVVVVNKPGGGAIPGRVEVVRSKPDGYTLLFGWGSGEDLVVPHQRSLPYDLFKDFDTISYPAGSREELGADREPKEVWTFQFNLTLKPLKELGDRRAKAAAEAAGKK